MIIDSRAIAHGSTLHGDLCIVGGGAAGIAIAREFLNHHWRVVLLESGETKPRHANQSLNRAEITGLPYPSLEVCRRRVLGGSTTIWGGWCRPLDVIDFEQRDWVPYSGWPFKRSDLQSQYARACVVCKAAENGSDRESADLPNSQTLLSSVQNHFEDILFHVAGTRFGETYVAALKEARNIELMLHANALEIQTDDTCRMVISIRAATLAGNQFNVCARNFVLAGGGIENPRLLLVSRRVQSSGVGNENGLVGRFFADHLHFKLRNVSLRGRRLPDFYREHTTENGVFRGGMSVTDNTRRQDRLLGFAITIHNANDPHDFVYPPFNNVGYASLYALVKALRDKEVPERFGHHIVTLMRHLDNAAILSFKKVVKPRWRTLAIGCRAEQSPNPNSRVLLDEERDVFGVNKVRLDWRLTAKDRESIARSRQLLEKEWIFPGGQTTVRGKEEQRPEIAAAAHHMGTTRMHRDPKQGVVDEMCRVHGVRNLYIAGGSVFPTTGWAPPTLTVVALSLRLADFLKQNSSI